MSVGLRSLTSFYDGLSYSPSLCESTGTTRIYRRHTNFALESIEQTFNGQADFSRKVTCLISRNGDLIHRMYLRVELDSVTLNAKTGTQTETAFRWVDWIGEALIKNVEIEIGGQRINVVSPEKYRAPMVCCAA